MSRIILLFIAVCGLIEASAQEQTVRGKISDRETHQPLNGARLTLGSEASDSVFSASSDSSGDFSFPGVPVGRYNLFVKLASYQEWAMQNIIVSSAKEVVLFIEMQPEFTLLKGGRISSKRKDQPNNQLALVSARLFTVDETDRFAGSRGDPARMASNFAGVQGADDSRNDIVVRGNSPQGVLWRLEGIDIPNPNHFAIPGTTGGPVSILNNRILANSDFFTGAFPAEYGNSTAGVFDIRMRNGNNNKHEFSTQFGFLGWDLMAEGPFSKKSKASFLVAYRYSTLAAFEKLNIRIGTDAVPRYQDATFKVNIPIGKKDNLSFFGVGGTSSIDIMISDQEESSSELYGDNDRDQLFGSSMGVVGASYTKSTGSKSYLKAVLAQSHQQVDAIHNFVFRHTVDSFMRDGELIYKFKLDSLVKGLDYRFRINTSGLHVFHNSRLGRRTTLRAGLNLSLADYRFMDSARSFDFMDSTQYWKWSTRWTSDGTGLQIMPYVQMKWQATRKLSVSGGWTGQYFKISEKGGASNTSTHWIQPRLGLRYLIKPGQSVNLGMGIHSQTQPAYTYYYILPGNERPHNMNMGLTVSRHLVAGYDRVIGKDKRFRFETYYQYVDNIPVTLRPGSFSLANTGTGFSRFFPDSLVNEGSAQNYGVEFTLEKSFTKGYYYLISLSIFDAQYKGSDGVSRSSDFNTTYAGNALLAREWKVGRRSVLNAGGKLTMAGARRYSPMDTLASRRQREYVELDAEKNTKRFGSAYVRLDLRLSYKINAKKLTHEFAIDLVNVSNRQNILKYSYTSEAPFYREEYQLGFLPLFYYRLDF